jgi:hypothetical protein
MRCRGAPCAPCLSAVSLHGWPLPTTNTTLTCHSHHALRSLAVGSPLLAEAHHCRAQSVAAVKCVRGWGVRVGAAHATQRVHAPHNTQCEEESSSV